VTGECYEKTRVFRAPEVKVSHKKGTNMSPHRALARTCTVLGLLALLGGAATALAGDDGAPRWQPMLAKSFKGDAKNIDVTSLIVYRDTGCVFLLVDGKSVYCSPAGAANFKLVTETWKEVRAHAEKTKAPKRLFVLAETSIKESRDGGDTWLKPIALPRGFVITSSTWVEHDAANDIIYLMKPGSDLYKLVRRK
jgi:hypothetical protein